jgi:hypothetical protein
MGVLQKKKEEERCKKEGHERGKKGRGKKEKRQERVLRLICSIFLFVDVKFVQDVQFVR